MILPVLANHTNTSVRQGTKSMNAWRLLVLSAFFTVQMAAQTPTVGKNCRIVDVVKSGSGHDYYIDGKRAGSQSDVNLLIVLQHAEASSPLPCLRLFVPTSVKEVLIENARVVAGKMQYQEFHVYVYDERHDFVNEMIWETQPSHPLRGGVRWPDESVTPESEKR